MRPISSNLRVVSSWNITTTGFPQCTCIFACSTFTIPVVCAKMGCGEFCENLIYYIFVYLCGVANQETDYSSFLPIFFHPEVHPLLCFQSKGNFLLSQVDSNQLSLAQLRLSQYALCVAYSTPTLTFRLTQTVLILHTGCGKLPNIPKHTYKMVTTMPLTLQQMNICIFKKHLLGIIKESVMLKNFLLFQQK